MTPKAVGDEEFRVVGLHLDVSIISYDPSSHFLFINVSKQVGMCIFPILVGRAFTYTYLRVAY